MAQATGKVLLFHHMSTFHSITPLGDSALIVQFEPTISPVIHSKVRAFLSWIETQKLHGLIECVPAFTSVTLHFDPWIASERGTIDPYQKLKELIQEHADNLEELPTPPSRTIEIPVDYGGDAGPDLDFVALHTGLSRDEVISLHSSPSYLVYMVGFMPGFPYLGGMDQRLSTPRRSSPRARVPAGSVGIASTQTGVYPLETPGGWQIIGRTSLTLFDPQGEPPTLLRAGDRVKFVPRKA